MKPEDLRQQKRVTARKVILTSFIVDFLDIILNFGVALLSGSIIMTTQVLEAFSDLTSSLFLLIGLRRSLKLEDKTHPFGYGREIYFWTLLASLVMFGVTSIFSFYLGWERFNKPEVIKDINLAIFILAVTFFTNLYAFLLSIKRLLRSRSMKQITRIFYRSSLVETKTTFTLDLMGTTASLFGLIALAVYTLTGDLRFDGLGAMVIGITLGIFSVFLVLGIRDLLVGKSASVEVQNKIKDLALDIDGVREVTDLKTLHIGPEKLLVNLDVHMKSNFTTKELEKLIEEIKIRIQKEVPSVKYIQVELDTHR